MPMTDAEQVVTQLRRDFEEFVDKVFKARNQIGITRIKQKGWFNHAVADLETGLEGIETALLTTPKKSKKEMEQQQLQRQEENSNGGSNPYRRSER